MEETVLSTLLVNLACIVSGTLVACVLGCLPALHVYNVAGMVFLLWEPIVEATGVSPLQLCLFGIALVVGYSFINTVPSVFWGAPDESTAFLVLPSSKYMMQGRGYEASVLTGIGSLIGAFMLLAATPLILWVLPTFKRITAPHNGWIIVTVFAFLLLSEWPKSFDRAKTKGGRLLDAYTSCGAGILTFFLAGFLGIIVTSKTIVPLDIAFQSIMPVFVGLFAVPWVIGNIISRTEIPPQVVPDSLDISPKLLARGCGSGSLGGFFAACFPLVTAGIGAIISGHATAQQDDRLFILSYGVNKVIYYVGAFLFFFIPGMAIQRGGMAIMMSPHYRPEGAEDFVAALGAIALSAGLSFFMLCWLSSLSIRVVRLVDYRLLSWFALALCFVIVGGLTGWMGLFVMLVAASIGYLPVAYNSRRSNCMGVLLLPISLYMLGYGPAIQAFLGLD